jgi:hypothetical protein
MDDGHSPPYVVEGFEVGEGFLFEELELVHVDAVGEAEVAAGEAGAVEDGVLGADFELFGAALRVFFDVGAGDVDGILHFAGDAEGGGENPFVPLVGEPALGTEALIAR